jgi:MFS family permease
MRGRWVSLGVICLPLTLIGFSFSNNLGISLFFVALLGVSQIMILNLSNSLIHSEVEDRLRGRVASIFGLTFFGLMPLGGLIMGAMAERFSEPAAVIFAAIAFGVCTFTALTVRKHLRTVS